VRIHGGNGFRGVEPFRRGMQVSRINRPGAAPKGTSPKNLLPVPRDQNPIAFRFEFLLQQSPHAGVVVGQENRRHRRKPVVGSTSGTDAAECLAIGVPPRRRAPEARRGLLLRWAKGLAMPAFRRGCRFSGVSTLWPSPFRKDVGFAACRKAPAGEVPAAGRRGRNGTRRASHNPLRAARL
jgi:hypothetical protein